jgi:hypothetical protein
MRGNETGSPVPFVGTQDNAINISFLCFVCKREAPIEEELWRGNEEEEGVCVCHIKRQEYNKTLGCENGFLLAPLDENLPSRCRYPT